MGLVARSKAVRRAIVAIVATMAAMAAPGALADRFRPTILSGIADPDPSVRSAAAASLGFYRDNAVLERLSGLLDSDPHPDVRLSVLLAIPMPSLTRARGSPQSPVGFLPSMARRPRPPVALRPRPA